jgi:hypothetical protein
MNAESGCIHDLLLFSSDAELEAASHAFIADGIRDGDLVIVHGADHDVEVLRRLFDDGPRVQFESGSARYRRMMGTVGEYQRLCERENATGRRLRSTGPVPFPTEPEGRAEWMRCEALVDRVLGPYDFPWTGVDAPLPRNPRNNGAGLWLARQLCEGLTITPGRHGDTEVRLIYDTRTHFPSDT